MPSSGPLSFPQERIYFLQQLDPFDHSYRFQASLTFVGDLDIVALQRSLDAIVTRHEIFRMTFTDVVGVPRQHVTDEAVACFRFVDVSSTAESSGGLEQEIAKALVEPFDMARLPLARWTLVRVAVDRHVLVHVEHHLVHDGWSHNLFLDELAQHYRRYAFGAPLALESPASFTKYVRKLREEAETDAAREGLEYWRSNLTGAPKSLDLPTDRRRPPVLTHAGGAVIHALAPKTLASLRRASRAAGVTPFMTVLAIFAIVLQRYSGETDLCLGTGTAARETPEAEKIIGMLVATIVLRLDLSEDPTFPELLERVKSVTLGAFARQHVPLARVVEVVAPARDASVNPLYNVAFSFHDSSAPLLDFGGPRAFVDLMLDNESAKIDLNVISVPRPDGALMKWEYNSDLFDRSTIERMVAHFDCLLEAVLDEPERRISRYPMMRAAERKTVTETFATNVTVYPRDATITSIFEGVARRDPGAIALVSDTVSFTYSALDARANRFARLLVSEGIEAGARVAMLMSRSPDGIVAMLGILKAGCTYVPLDVRHPAERLAWTLEDASIALTVTDGSLYERLPAGARAIRIEGLGADTSPASVEQVRLTDDACAPAYVMYTSGSTGFPKGVIVPHRGVVRLVRSGGEAPMIAGDIVLHYSSPAFDGATYEIWGALLNGLTLAVPSADMLSLAELDDAIAEFGVTVLIMTTPLFHEFADRKHANIGTLRMVSAGGDVLQPGPALSFLENVPGVYLINGYGPTENTTYVSRHVVTRDDAHRKTIPIGRPIANTTAYVLDARDLPVPIDVPGEICTGGDGVAIGYLDRPDLSAARFSDDPFSGVDGARMYRTGDIGRWRGDGTLEFLGRRDGQVKVRGFRIETSGIEATIRTYPSVRDAAVIAVRGADGDTSLSAYIVVADGYDVRELKAFLRARLADYEIPPAIFTVENLPSSVGGKIDRAALAGASIARSVPGASVDDAGEPTATIDDAPRGETEERVAAIWRDVLRMPSIGRNRDFFDLGGHSLMAMRVLARIVDAFGASVSLREFFDRRTISELADFIDKAPRATVTVAEDFSKLSDAELDALLSAEERAAATDER